MPNHGELAALDDHWAHAAVRVRPERMLPLVLRAAQQQERWAEMAAGIVN